MTTSVPHTTSVIAQVPATATAKTLDITRRERHRPRFQEPRLHELACSMSPNGKRCTKIEVGFRNPTLTHIIVTSNVQRSAEKSVSETRKGNRRDADLKGRGEKGSQAQGPKASTRGGTSGNIGAAGRTGRVCRSAKCQRRDSSRPGEVEEYAPAQAFWREHPHRREVSQREYLYRC